jgi:hypothetical protein
VHGVAHGNHLVLSALKGDNRSSFALLLLTDEFGGIKSWLWIWQRPRKAAMTTMAMFVFLSALTRAGLVATDFGHGVINYIGL